MVRSIRPTGVSAISAISAGSSKTGGRTGGALRKLAGRIAGKVGREFRLLDEERERSDDRPPHDGEDLYEIREVARELAADLHAKPADEGRLARSLGAFAQESASLLAARPEAASLDTIAHAIAAHERPADGETVDRAVGQIDQTVLGISESRPR